jgi:hypothetical protein
MLGANSMIGSSWNMGKSVVDSRPISLVGFSCSLIRARSFGHLSYTAYVITQESLKWPLLKDAEGRMK